MNPNTQDILSTGENTLVNIDPQDGTLLIVIKDESAVVDTISRYAMQFDGVQNYLNLGKMGSFGGATSAGFYGAFTMKTTSTAVMGMGNTNIDSNDSSLNIKFNMNYNGAASPGDIYVANTARFNLRGIGGTNGGVTVNWNDGNYHKFIITAGNVGSGDVTVMIDGQVQPIQMSAQTGPNNNVGWGRDFLVGANRGTTVSNYGAYTIKDLVLGTRAGTNVATVYATYDFTEGTGVTTLDGSGKGNTGVLSHGTGAYPAWIFQSNTIQANMDVRVTQDNPTYTKPGVQIV